MPPELIEAIDEYVGLMAKVHLIKARIEFLVGRLANTGQPTVDVEAILRERDEALAQATQAAEALVALQDRMERIEEALPDEEDDEEEEEPVASPAPRARRRRAKR